MGRSPKKSNGEVALPFEELPELTAPSPFDMGVDAEPAWSINKSQIVMTYLRLYQNITRGGFYIDGFAAPQRSDRAEDLWTVKKVLEMEPKWIRRFWLCDIDRSAEAQLRELKAKHDNKPRHVSVFIGDFNKKVDTILETRRIIRSNSSCFAFLDQRTTECHWSTLRKLAAHRPRRRIELLYFFPAGWIHRTMGGTTTEAGRRALDLWWGRSSWMEDLGDLNRESQARLVQRRFETELGYRHVLPVPIRRDGSKGSVYYYLIHASDHPQANQLMKRAYRKVTKSHVDGTPESQVKMDRFWR